MRIAAPPPRATVEALAAPPTLSVVIAAYQVADVVGEAVASALDQTEPPHEVVVCDDGSTDDLRGALAPFLNQIVLVAQEHRGASAARNHAARVASGEFIVILDADDQYLPGRLDALGRLAVARPDLDILTTDAYLELKGQALRTVYTPAWPFPVGDQRRSILERNFVFGHAAVRRESFLRSGGMDESLALAEDWDVWVRLVLDGALIGAVLEPLARYRVREKSLSTDRARMLKDGTRAMQNALRHPLIRPHESAVALQTIGRLEQELAVIRMRESLRTRAPDARRYASTVALQRFTPLPTRLKAAAAVIAPRTAGRLLRRRQGRAWVGAGGTTVDDA